MVITERERERERERAHYVIHKTPNLERPRKRINNNDNNNTEVEEEGRRTWEDGWVGGLGERV